MYATKGPHKMGKKRSTSFVIEEVCVLTGSSLISCDLVGSFQGGRLGKLGPPAVMRTFKKRIGDFMGCFLAELQYFMS